MPPHPPQSSVDMTQRGDDAAAFVVAAPRWSVLRQRSDFLKAAKARRAGTAGLLLQARRRADDELTETPIRVGFTCSKKIGNAVMRNRAKRRLRALAREVIPRLGRAGWDYVLVGRPDATVSRNFSDLRDDLVTAIRRIHAPKAPR
ncbi:ribonuclease P protein component [Paracoccus sediminicola]|uniref:ribonuclease P protein component n=1 Tax=Paracoccus sediminicola TaxID=3017783 RepID=UPI003EBF4744